MPIATRPRKTIAKWIDKYALETRTFTWVRVRYFPVMSPKIRQRRGDQGHNRIHHFPNLIQQRTIRIFLSVSGDCQLERGRLDPNRRQLEFPLKEGEKACCRAQILESDFHLPRAQDRPFLRFHHLSQHDRRGPRPSGSRHATEPRDHQRLLRGPLLLSESRQPAALDHGREDGLWICDLSGLLVLGGCGFGLAPG